MSFITKSELIARVVEKSGVTASSSDAVITAALSAITEFLKEGKEVRLTGFGTFSVTPIAARAGRNPRTGETIQISASNRPVFKVGKTLKDAVNGEAAQA
jgi:DNA-binding protein HU-beta